MDGIIRRVLLRKYYRGGKIAFSNQKKYYQADVPLFFIDHSETNRKRGTRLIIPYYQGGPSGTVLIILQKPVCMWNPNR